MYIKVRVKAGAKTEEVVQDSPDHLRISVKEKAEANRANTRVGQILAQHFKTKNVRLVSGHHSPSKIFAVGD